MASTDGTNKNAILSRIITIIKTVSNFDDRVYKGQRVLIPENGVIVHITGETRPDDTETTGHAEHYVQFIILIKMRSNIPAGISGGSGLTSVRGYIASETEQENFIELVGLVVDALEDQWYDDSGNWDRLSMPDMDYRFGREGDFNYYTCGITVVCRTQY